MGTNSEILTFITENDWLLAKIRSALRHHLPAMANNK